MTVILGADRSARPLVELRRRGHWPVPLASTLPDPVVLTRDPHDLDALADHTPQPITVAAV